MKKTFAIMLVLTLALSCALGGCSSKRDLSGSKYLGVWEVGSTSVAGETDDAGNTLSRDLSVELMADGTALVRSFDHETGETEVSNCTWRETGSGVKISGDMRFKMEDVDGKLDANLFGFHLIFEYVEQPS